MPAVLSYPGVYVEEVPSGVRSITGVPTSVTAFVGRAQRGPVNEPTVINGYADYERVFGGLWLLSPMSYAVRDYFLNGGGQAVLVRLNNGATAAQLTLASSGGNLVLVARHEGSWGNKLRALVDHDTRKTDKGEDDPDLFNLTLMDTGAGTTEKHLNLSINSTSPRHYHAVLEKSSGLVKVLTAPATNARPNETVDDKGNPSPVGTSTEGVDGNALTAAQFTGPGLRGRKEGLYALEKVDAFNLLCLPPHSLSGNGENIEVALVEDAAKYCQERRAILLVDPPTGWDSVAHATSGFKDGDLSNLRSSNAAVYFPRLIQPNPLREQQLETFAPCGAVAGVIARTDTNRGVWKAPAGLDALLTGVTKLSVPLTDAENGQLHPLGINCLRAMPAAGRVVWGARTTRGADALADEWKHLPVRRLALYIEESLYRGIQWVVFEPNGEPLWSQIRLNVGAFMQDLFRQGAFQGQSPRDAYFVKCDKETTTQSDINQGVVNLHVGFAPLKPAEFVVLKLQQMAGQVAA